MLYKAKGAGMDLPNHQVATHILFGLPTEYNHLKTSTKVMDPAFDLSSFKAALFEAENLHQAIEKSSSEESRAYAAWKPEGKPWQKGPWRKQEKDRKDKKEAGQGERKPQAKEDTPRTRKFSKQGIRCYQCQGRRHIARECPSPRRSERPPGKDERPESEEPKVGKATAWTSRSDSSGSHIEDYTKWLLDTGATHHMTSLKENFEEDFQEGETRVAMADGRKILARGRGTTKIELVTTTGTLKVDLKDTLFVPELAGNLLSGRKIVQAGNKIEMGKDKVTIRNQKGEVVAEALPIDGLYFFQAMGQRELEAKTSMSMAEKEKELWHRRLAHLHTRAVKETVGFDQEGEKKCDVCRECKITATPFPKGKVVRSTEPLAIIHTDLMNAGTPSRDGERYVLTCIDDCTRYGVSYYLKKKSDTFQKFKEFHKMAETQCERKIKALRSDGGGEYMSQEFADYLKEHGIT